MTLENAVQSYGYLAILVGTLLEGETIVLLGGFAAHRGYLDLTGVMIASFAGSVTGDLVYFEIGRRKGMAFLARRSAWQVHAARVQQLVQRHQTWLILAFRFMYGIRTVTPFVLGASGIPQLRFAVLNIVSAALWAVAFSALGFALGNTLQAVLGDLHRYELAVFLAIASGGLLVWLWRSRRRPAQGTEPL